MDIVFISYLIGVCGITAFVAAIIHTVYKIKMYQLIDKEKPSKTLWYRLIERMTLRNHPKK